MRPQKSAPAAKHPSTMGRHSLRLGVRGKVRDIWRGHESYRILTESMRYEQSVLKKKNKEKEKNVENEKCLRVENKTDWFGHSVGGQKWEKKLKSWGLITRSLEYHTKVEFGLFSVQEGLPKAGGQEILRPGSSCRKIIQCVEGKGRKQ